MNTEHTDAIHADTVERACPRCAGSGQWVEKHQVCYRCKGLGRIKAKPPHKAPAEPQEKAE